MKTNTKGKLSQLPKTLTVGAVAMTMAFAPVLNNMTMIVRADETPATRASASNDYIMLAKRSFDWSDDASEGGCFYTGATHEDYGGDSYIDSREHLLFLAETEDTKGWMTYDEPMLETRGFSSAFQMEMGYQDDDIIGFTYAIGDALMSHFYAVDDGLGYAGVGSANSIAIALIPGSGGTSALALLKGGELVPEKLISFDSSKIAPTGIGMKWNLYGWVDYNPKTKQLTFRISNTNNREAALSETFNVDLAHLVGNDLYLGMTAEIDDVPVNSYSNDYVAIAGFYADNNVRRNGITISGNTVEDVTNPTKPTVTVDQRGYNGVWESYYNIGGSSDDHKNLDYYYKFDNEKDLKPVPKGGLKYNPNRNLIVRAIDGVGHRSEKVEYVRPIVNVEDGTLWYDTNKYDVLAPGVPASLIPIVPEGASFLEWRNTEGFNELTFSVNEKNNAVFTMPLTGNYLLEAVSKYNTPTEAEMPSDANIVAGENGIRLENAGLHKGWKYALMHEGEMATEWVTANGVEAITFGASADIKIGLPLTPDTNYEIAVKVPKDDKALASEVAKKAVRTTPARIAAKTTIDEMVASVKGTVNTLLNLTQAQHDQFFAEFDTAANEIKAAIDAATTQDAVNTAKDNGLTRLTNMLNFMIAKDNQNLVDAKTNALINIFNAKENAMKAINDLKNLTFDEKAEFIKSLNTTYDKARIDINAQTLVNGVETQRDAWLNGIASALTDAKNKDASAFAKVKDAAIKAINDKVIAVNSEINALLNIKPLDKIAAQTAVKFAAETGISFIKSADSELKISSLKFTTIVAIESILNDKKADNAKILEDAKVAAVSNMTNAANNAYVAIDALKNLDAEDVKYFKALVGNALTKGIANVTSNRTVSVNGVNSFTDTALTAIDKASKDAINADNTNLADAKKAAINDLSNYKAAKNGEIIALDNLTQAEEDNAILAVSNAINAAIAAIHAADNTVAINAIVKDAKVEVDNIVHDIKLNNNENITAYKDAAKKAVATLLNETKTTIGALPNLSKEDVKNAIAELDAALANVNTSISNATVKYEVDTAKSAGILVIEGILSGYKVLDANNIQDWKQLTNASITMTANTAIDAIENMPNLSDVEKQTAKAAIIEKMNAGIAEVNAATERAAILALKTTYETAISGILTDAKDTAEANLAAAKAEFNKKIDAKAMQVRKAILGLSNLTFAEKRLYTSRLAIIVRNAKDDVREMSKVSDVETLYPVNETEINNLFDTAVKENNNYLSRAKARALTAIVNEERDALKALGNLQNLTVEEMKAAKKAVNNASIKGRVIVKNADRISTIIDARDEAVETIKEVVTNAKALDAANLTAAKDNAETALDNSRTTNKALIANLINLTAGEVKAAEAAIKKVVDDAMAAVAVSETIVNVTDITTNAEKALAAIIAEYQTLDVKNLEDAKEAAFKDVMNKEETVKAVIDVLKNILELDKLDAKKAIDDIITKALSDIEANVSMNDVKAIVKSVFADMDKVLANAKALDAKNLADAKAASKVTVNDQVADLKATIDTMANLTKKDQADLKASIDAIVNAGMKDIDATEVVADLAAINAAIKADFDKVMADGAERAAKNLANAKAEAKAEIEKLIKDANAKIDALTYLTKEQKDAYKAKIAEIAKDYAALIDAMETLKAISDYTNGVASQFNTINAEAIKANENANPSKPAVPATKPGTESTTQPGTKGTETNGVATGDATNAVGSIALMSVALGGMLLSRKRRSNK